MKQFGGWYFPDHEVHLIEWMRKQNQIVNGRQAYQYKKIQAALGWCKSFRTAIEVGAHIGTWTYYLTPQFQHIHAFEPVKAHRECFHANLAEWLACGDRVILHDIALGNKTAQVAMHTEPSSSGDTWVNGYGDITMSRLDDLLFAETDVDFIKLDCEGYEAFALQGAEKLIARCKPCIVVEQKPGKAQKFGLKETEAVTWLQEHGAVLRKEMAGDYILSWP